MILFYFTRRKEVFLMTKQEWFVVIIFIISVVVGIFG